MTLTEYQCNIVHDVLLHSKEFRAVMSQLLGHLNERTTADLLLILHPSSSEGTSTFRPTSTDPYGRLLYPARQDDADTNDEV